MFLRELTCHSGHGAECERTVGMLDDLVADQCARPVWLVAVTTAHADVHVVDVTARAEGTPAPDITVCAVGSSLAGVEGAGVKHTLMPVLRPVGSRVVEAGFQGFIAAGHHIFHLTAP